MNKLVSCLLASLAVFSLPAHAAELQCSGKVLQVNMHAPDRLMLQLDSMNAPVFICTPNANWIVPGTTYTTSGEMCRTLAAIFLAAKLQDRAFGVVYFDGADVPATCNGWTWWKNANVRYFSWAD